MIRSPTATFCNDGIDLPEKDGNSDSAIAYPANDRIRLRALRSTSKYFRQLGTVRANQHLLIPLHTFVTTYGQMDHPQQRIRLPRSRVSHNDLHDGCPPISNRPFGSAVEEWMACKRFDAGLVDGFVIQTDAAV